jgi:hypothetical protein
MRSIPLYAPDGMTSTRGNLQRFAGNKRDYMLADVVRVEDRHDDGLVHNHGWAMSGESDTAARAVPGGTFSTAPFAGSATVDRFRARDTVWAEDRHDDGLVHNHEWAVSGK